LQQSASRTSLLRARPFIILILLIALTGLLIAACGDDDNGTATPTAPAASSSSGTLAATPAGSEGAPAVCTQEDAQRGTITTLDFNDETGTYDPGDSIEITFTIVNCGDNDITLSYPTTQRYVITAKDPQGNDVWSSADDEVFNQVEGQEIIQPNKTIVYTETWDQKDSDGEQAPDAEYKISAFSIGCTAGQSDCHFGPVRFVQIGEVQPSAS
jgi:hypothetical protein